MMSGRGQYLLTFSLLLTGAVPASADPVVGRPTSLQVQPEAVLLTGPRARQQLVVTGRYADGMVRDLTAFASVASDAEAVAAADGLVLPRKNGSATLRVTAGRQTVRVPVSVMDFDRA